jgi:O-antigen/teichoic acid export membrane protein
LVVGNFLFSLFFVVFSYRFHPYRPRFALDREALRVGFGFGQSVFVGGLMGYIATTADNMIVAKLLGTATLATYMVAFAAATLPMRLVSGLLGQILFPSFAAVGRQGGEQVERITERAFVLGCSLLVALLTPMFLLSREAMTILYGKPEYIAAAPLLCVMLVGGLFRSLSQILTPLLHGLARPDIDARASVFEAAIFVALLFAFTFRFGAMGAAWAGVLAYGISFSVRAAMSRSLAPKAFGQLPATLLLALACAGAGWGAGTLALNSPWLADASVWTRAIVGSLVSLSVLGIELAILFPSLGDEVRQFRSLLQRRSGKAST